MSGERALDKCTMLTFGEADQTTLTRFDVAGAHCFDPADEEKLRSIIESEVRKTRLCAILPFINKRSFYQDRLGTNMGKALKNKDAFVAGRLLVQRRHPGGGRAAADGWRWCKAMTLLVSVTRCSQNDIVYL
jgi:hypothetical protein